MFGIGKGIEVQVWGAVGAKKQKRSRERPQKTKKKLGKWKETAKKP